MNSATTEALEASIKHWEENLGLAKTNELTYDDIGADACALCSIFVMPRATYCINCPVRIRTGYRACRGTPWVDVADALNSHDTVVTSNAVQAEIDFLESLREEPCS